MIPIRTLGAMAVTGLFMLSACQANGAPRPAVLESSDVETMANVKTVLAGAMNKSSVEIGPGDPTQTSTISVLPPRLSPYEGMSPAAPTQFDIVKTGSQCSVVRRDTGEAYKLDGVSCRALDE